ncbi:thioredoxin domain-containing protein [Haladaptatus sp. CMAA 1911]|uniref:thioredoxin domain-containing protein n=1 Tax=unclassified Haladaptatus TaxID=2622732 RepID=UPI003753F452
MSKQNASRRTFLKTTGVMAAVGLGGSIPVNAATDLSNAPVPDDADERTYATMGTNPDAPTATVYGNFKCPYTQKFVRDGNLEAVLDEYVTSGDLNLRFRALAYQPPGTTSHGTSTYYISDSDPLISEAALGVWNVSPEDYWEFFNYMFSDLIRGNVSFSEMEDRMDSADVSSRETIIDRASSGRYDDDVEENRYTAGDYGVSWTPTMVFDGDKTSPHHDVDDLLSWLGERIPNASASSSSDDSSSSSESTSEEDSNDDTSTEETTESDQSSDDSESEDTSTSNTGTDSSSDKSDEDSDTTSDETSNSSDSGESGSSEDATDSSTDSADSPSSSSDSSSDNEDTGTVSIGTICRVIFG